MTFDDVRKIALAWPEVEDGSSYGTPALKVRKKMLARLKANGVAIAAGPLLTIPPAIHSFYFFDPNGIRLELTTPILPNAHPTLEKYELNAHDELAAWEREKSRRESA